MQATKGLVAAVSSLQMVTYERCCCDAQLCINVAGKLDAGCKNQTPHKSIKRTLCQLISNHYVERAPPADLPMPRVTVHPKALSKRGGMSSSAKAAADQAENVRRLDKVSAPDQPLCTARCMSRTQTSTRRFECQSPLRARCGGCSPHFLRGRLVSLDLLSYLLQSWHALASLCSVEDLLHAPLSGAKQARKDPAIMSFLPQGHLRGCSCLLVHLTTLSIDAKPLAVMIMVPESILKKGVTALPEWKHIVAIFYHL